MRDAAIGLGYMVGGLAVVTLLFAGGVRVLEGVSFPLMMSLIFLGSIAGFAYLWASREEGEPIDELGLGLVGFGLLVSVIGLATS